MARLLTFCLHLLCPRPSATHNNLFTNLDCGKCLRPWQSGGDGGRGAHSGEEPGPDVGSTQQPGLVRAALLPVAVLLPLAPLKASTPPRSSGSTSPCTSVPPAAAANSTWWGVWSSRPTAKPWTLPTCDFGAYLNWVGPFAGSVTNSTCSASRWTVQNSGSTAQLVPDDLFVAQRDSKGLYRP